MSEKINIIQTEIGIDLKDSIDSIEQLSDVMSATNSHFTALSKNIKDSNTSISELIKRELNDLKNVKVEGTGKTAAANIRNKIETAIVEAVQNSTINLTTAKAGGKISLSLSDDQYKKIASQIVNKVADVVTVNVPEQFKVSLSDDTKKMIKSKIEEAVSKSVNKGISLDFFGEEKNKLKLPIDRRLLENIFDQLNIRLTKYLKSEAGYAFDIENFKAKPLDIKQVMVALDKSIQESVETLKLHPDVLIQIQEKIRIFNSKLSGMAATTLDMALALGKLDVNPGSAEDMAKLTSIFKVLQTNIDTKVEKYIKEVAKAVKKYTSNNELSSITAILDSAYGKIRDDMFKPILDIDKALSTSSESYVKLVNKLKQLSKDFEIFNSVGIDSGDMLKLLGGIENLNFDNISKAVQNVSKYKDNTLLKSVEGMKGPINKLAKNFDNISAKILSISEMVNNPELLKGKGNVRVEDLLPGGNVTDKSKFKSGFDIQYLLEGLNKDVSDKVKQSIAEITKQYPIVNDIVKSVQSSNGLDKTMFAGAKNMTNRIFTANSGGILLNSDIFNDPKKLESMYKRQLKSGHLAKGFDDPIKSIIAHEVGHLIENFYTNLPSVSDIKKKMDTLISKIKAKNFGDPSKEISGYALKNDKEMIAELTSMSMSGKYKDKKFIKEFDAILEEVMSERTKLAAHSIKDTLPEGYSFKLGLDKDGELTDRIARRLNQIKDEIDKTVDDYLTIQKKVLSSSLKLGVRNEDELTSKIEASDEVPKKKRGRKKKEVTEEIVKEELIKAKDELSKVSGTKPIIDSVVEIEKEMSDIGVNMKEMKKLLQSVNKAIKSNLIESTESILNSLKDLGDTDISKAKERLINDLGNVYSKLLDGVALNITPSDMTKVYTKIQGAGLQFYTKYMNKMAAEISKNDMFEINVNDIHPKVKEKLRDMYGLQSVKELKGTVLEGSESQAMIMEKYAEMFRDMFSANNLNIMNQMMGNYKNDIKALNVKPDNTVVEYIRSSMLEFQKVLIAKFKVMIKEQFTASTNELRSVTVSAVPLNSRIINPPVVNSYNKAYGVNSAYSNIRPERPVGRPSYMDKKYSEFAYGGNVKKEDTSKLFNLIQYYTRNLAAGAIVGAPTGLAYAALSDYYEADYYNTKARQNISAKYRGTGQKEFQDTATNIINNNGVTYKSEAEKRRAINNKRLEILDYSDTGVKGPLGDLGVNYGMNQSDISKMYEVATRKEDQVGNAYEITRAAARVGAVERSLGKKGDFDSEKIVTGLSSVMSQWDIGAQDIGKYTDMITKASLMNQASVQDVLQVQQKAGATFRLNMKGDSKEKDFAKSLVLSVLSTEATGKTGNEMGTFWRNSFEAATSRPENVKTLQTMATNPVMFAKGDRKAVNLDPYIYTKQKDGSVKTEKRDSFDVTMNILEGAKRLKESGQSREADKLLSTLYDSRNKNNIQAVNEIFQKMASSKMDVMAAVDQITALDVESQINEYIVGMSKSMDFQKMSLLSSFQRMTSEILDQFKPQVMSIMRILTAAMNGLSDNSIITSNMIKTLGEVVAGVVISGAFGRFKTYRAAINEEQKLTKDIRPMMAERKIAENELKGIRGKVTDSDNLISEIQTQNIAKRKSYVKLRDTLINEVPGMRSDLKSEKVYDIQGLSQTVAEVKASRDRVADEIRASITRGEEPDPEKVAQYKQLRKRTSKYNKLLGEARDEYSIATNPRAFYQRTENAVNRIADKRGVLASQLDAGQITQDFYNKRILSLDKAETKIGKKVDRAVIFQGEIAPGEEKLAKATRKRYELGLDEADTQTIFTKMNEKISERADKAVAAGANKSRVDLLMSQTYRESEQNNGKLLKSSTILGKTFERLVIVSKSAVNGMKKVAADIKSVGIKQALNNLDIGGGIKGVPSRIGAGISNIGSFLKPGLSSVGAVLGPAAALQTGMSAMEWGITDDAGRAQLRVDALESVKARSKAYKEANPAQSIMLMLSDIPRFFSALGDPGTSLMDWFQPFLRSPLSGLAGPLASVFGLSRTDNDIQNSLDEAKTVQMKEQMKDLVDKEKKSKKNMKAITYTDINGKKQGVLVADTQDMSEEDLKTRKERLDYEASLKRSATKLEETRSRLLLVQKGMNEDSQEYYDTNLKNMKKAREDQAEELAKLQDAYDTSIRTQARSLLSDDPKYTKASPNEKKVMEDTMIKTLATNDTYKSYKSSIDATQAELDEKDIGIKKLQQESYNPALSKMDKELTENAIEANRRKTEALVAGFTEGSKEVNDIMDEKAAKDIESYKTGINALQKSLDEVDANGEQVLRGDARVSADRQIKELNGKIADTRLSILESLGMDVDNFQRDLNLTSSRISAESNRATAGGADYVKLNEFQVKKYTIEKHKLDTELKKYKEAQSKATTEVERRQYEDLIVSTDAKIAQLEADNYNNNEAFKEKKRADAMTIIESRGNIREKDSEIQKSLMKRRGIGEDSYTYRMAEIQGLRDQNISNEEKKAQLQENLKAAKTDAETASILSQIRDIEASSEDNLSKIYDLQYQQSKVQLGVPEGIRAMSAYEYATSRNNGSNVTSTFGGTTINVDVGDVYGSDRDQLDRNLINPMVEKIRKEFDNANSLRNQSHRIPTGRYYRGSY